MLKINWIDGHFSQKICIDIVINIVSIIYFDHDNAYWKSNIVTASSLVLNQTVLRNTSEHLKMTQMKIMDVNISLAVAWNF